MDKHNIFNLVLYRTVLTLSNSMLIQKLKNSTTKNFLQHLIPKSRKSPKAFNGAKRMMEKRGRKYICEREQEEQ